MLSLMDYEIICINTLVLARLLTTLPRNPGSMATEVLKDPTQGSITFEDATVYFSWEEWALLDETQKLLYCDVMLENFALMASVGYWHEVEDEEAPSEQSASVERMSQVSMIFRFLAMTFTWEEWGQLDLAQKTLYQEVMLETCSLLVLLGLTQHYSTHTGEKPYECTACDEAFNHRSHLTENQHIHTGQKAYECSECGSTFIDHSDFIQGALALPRLDDTGKETMSVVGRAAALWGTIPSYLPSITEGNSGISRS
ncbi:hypothetical protein J1605_004222 [Eschrichtius robustus]|uniref:Zinc finger domain-containing protein n=1 Tax=Eschrichtius robustus TaxID=9764 RepID=A0AB34HEY0_ESCRO|nr:hypothetical protein J1605_004222 [Eschrichtius robustus]